MHVRLHRTIDDWTSSNEKAVTSLVQTLEELRSELSAPSSPQVRGRAPAHRWLRLHCPGHQGERAATSGVRVPSATPAAHCLGGCWGSGGASVTVVASWPLEAAACMEVSSLLQGAPRGPLHTQPWCWVQPGFPRGLERSVIG